MTNPIKLGLPISHTAFRLMQENNLDVDYIVWYGQIGVRNIADVAALKPVLLHDLAAPFWLNYADPFKPEYMAEARTILDIIKCPWLSTGIGASAEPQAHRDGPYREADKEQLQSREVVIENIVKHGKRLLEFAGIPLLLENFNYHPTNAYEYICEPVLFNELITEIGAGMLLDLAHARISANNMKLFHMGWEGDEKGYLEALPLNKVREIHVTRSGWQGQEMVDLHQPLNPENLELLGWVLDRAPNCEAVTLEVEELPEDVLHKQLEMMRGFLQAQQ